MISSRERSGEKQGVTSGNVMRLPRATYLLVLLDSNKQKPIIGRTALEKLTFLVEKKIIEELKIGLSTDTYHFRPWRFGPFTEEVFDDLNALQTVGLIAIEGEDEETQRFSVTENGHKSVQRLVKTGRLASLLYEEIDRIKTNYGKVSLMDLVERVYKEYPKFTERSEIKDSFMY